MVLVVTGGLVAGVAPDPAQEADEAAIRARMTVPTVDLMPAAYDFALSLSVSSRSRE
jgi:hypothetical protein